MVSTVAPRPLTVRVPAVLVSAMLGRAEARVMVKGLLPEPKEKSMMSLPAVALASAIACLSDPVPESELLTTVKVAAE